MQRMLCHNVTAFVEGDMEQIFINNAFRHIKVVSVSNGTGWSVTALAEQIASFYSVDQHYNHWILVWVDRERRNETADEIRDVIRYKLKSAGASETRIKVLISDRMTENIILADEKFISKKFDKPDYKFVSDGAGGKRILSTLYKEKGISYRETKHGLQALQQVRLFRSAKCCPQVAEFLSTNPMDCWWFHDENEPSAIEQ